jgi:hypothetical protein
MNIFIATKPLHDTNQTILSYRVEFSGEEIESDFQDIEMSFAFKTSTYLRTIVNRQQSLADAIHFLISRYVLMNFLDIREINIFVNSSKFDLYFNSNEHYFKFTKEEAKQLTELKDFFSLLEISPSIYSHTNYKPYNGEIEDVETIFELLYAECGRLEELLNSSNKPKN